MNNYYLLPDFYLPIEQCNVNPEEWLPCPVCKHKPKLWIFDNGRQAKCGCDTTYGIASAKAISINEYYQENGSTEGYSNDDFRDKWNKVANSRK